MMETEKGKRIEQILATNVTRENLAEALWCAESSQRMWRGRAEENRSFRLKAEDENAKLRELVEEDSEQLDRWQKKAEYYSQLSQLAEAENARLRELARDMYACISHANEQDWFYFERDKFGCGMSCTVNGEVCGLCVLADRMRELGIESKG